MCRKHSTLYVICSADLFNVPQQWFISYLLLSVIRFVLLKSKGEFQLYSLQTKIWNTIPWGLPLVTSVANWNGTEKLPFSFPIPTWDRQFTFTIMSAEVYCSASTKVGNSLPEAGVSCHVALFCVKTWWKAVTVLQKCFSLLKLRIGSGHC